MARRQSLTDQQRCIVRGAGCAASCGYCPPTLMRAWAGPLGRQPVPGAPSPLPHSAAQHPSSQQLLVWAPGRAASAPQRKRLGASGALPRLWWLARMVHLAAPSSTVPACQRHCVAARCGRRLTGLARWSYKRAHAIRVTQQPVQLTSPLPLVALLEAHGPVRWQGAGLAHPSGPPAVWCARAAAASRPGSHQRSDHTSSCGMQGAAQPHHASTPPQAQHTSDATETAKATPLCEARAPGGGGGAACPPVCMAHMEGGACSLTGFVAAIQQSHRLLSCMHATHPEAPGT
jgi:hypothetical protein